MLNFVNVAHYTSQIQHKICCKLGRNLAESNFQTRSRRILCQRDF
ncbi:DUF6783 domain-containing protein [Lachnospiraceae bacterium JLR.KK009]